MADLVGQRLASVVAVGRIDVGAVAAVDQVPGLPLERIRYIRQEGERRTADTTAEVAEGQVALIALAGVDEVDIGDVRPGLQRQLGLGLLLRGEGAEPMSSTLEIIHKYHIISAQISAWEKPF